MGSKLTYWRGCDPLLGVLTLGYGQRSIRFFLMQIQTKGNMKLQLGTS
jgi:hypothetical protein